MRRVMDKKSLILEKSPNEGLLELRQEIRLYLARNKGIHASVEQIVIGSGAEYLYNLIIALLGRNRIYGIEKPSYKKIEQVYRSSGAEICMLPLGKDGIDTSSLLSSKTDILHTTPYRSYPTGVTATASKRHEYIRWASTNSRYIVEDDFESEFSVSSKPEETLFSLSENDNVVYMNTFSKTVSPALRVGYMVLPKHLVEDFKNKLGFLSCTVPTFEQLLLTELISSGDFERHINRVRRKKRKEI
jgi:GntR family transcriptional regulator/MocR family aminotransferase